MAFPSVHDISNGQYMPDFPDEPTPHSGSTHDAASFGPRNAQHISTLRIRTESYMWAIRHQLENLNLTPEGYREASQSILTRAASVLNEPSPQIRATHATTSDDEVNITINFPRTFLLEGISHGLTRYLNYQRLNSQQPLYMACQAPPPQYSTYYQPCMYSHSSPTFPSFDQNVSFQPNITASSLIHQSANSVPDTQQQASYSAPSAPAGSQPPRYEQRPRRETAPEHQQQPGSQQQHDDTSGPGFLLASHRPAQRSVPSTAGASMAMHLDHGSEELFDGLDNPLNSMQEALLSTLPQSGFHSGPMNIGRLLLRNVPIGHSDFNEMKELIVIRENPLSSFDQGHLVEQWTQRQSEVEIILFAIGRKTNHLKGLNLPALMETTPEEQGVLLLKSLLKHTDSDPNIQMLAYLRQQGFLKRVEPLAPPDSCHRAVRAIGSISTSPSIPVGTDPIAAAPDRQSTDTTRNHLNPEDLPGTEIYKGPNISEYYGDYV